MSSTSGGEALPLVLATRSEGKLRELLPMIEAAGFRAVSLADAGVPQRPDEDALEVHETFEENALAKARWFSSLLPGRLVLADDSGLEVDALQGRPGVRSKRWCGRSDLSGAALDAANNATLLAALDGTLDGMHDGMRDGECDASPSQTRRDTHGSGTGTANRSARYVCAAASVRDDGPGARELVVRGETRGVIVTVARGSAGFGYDPYFLCDELGATFAEVSREAKATVSHRGRAFATLLAILRRPVDPAERRG